MDNKELVSVILAGVLGATVAFFPLLVAITIMNEMDSYHQSGVIMLALILGAFGGSIIHHVND